jgi:RNA polymerase sigma-70 factor, ECF subfamily
VASYYLKTKDDAVSVYNDAMVKILGMDYSHIDDMKSWVRRIVINKAIDFNRKYFVEGIVELTHLPFTTHETTIDEKMRIDDLISVIQKLPTSYRTVIMLHIVEEYKFHEIAEILNISEGGAKSLYYKGKEKLILLLQTEYKEYGHQ